MASGPEFVQYAADQLFIKITEAGKHMAPDLEEAAPYEGSKPYFLMDDIDNKEFLTEFVIETCKELPVPKPKKIKK